MDIINKLITEAPSLAAISIIVYMFLKSLERISKNFSSTILERDKMFVETLANLTNQLASLNTTFIGHATEVREGMNSMRRRTAKKQAPA